MLIIKKKKYFFGDTREGGVKALLAFFAASLIFKEYKYEIKKLFMSEKRKFFVYVTTK